MGKENYRIRDLPRGKRWAHFWQYYKLHVFAALTAAVLLGNMLYASFLKPRPDVSLLWFSGQYSLACEQALLEKLEQLPAWDLNGDGSVHVRVNHADFSAPFDQLSLSLQAELLTVCSIEDSCIYLLSSYAMEWMAENDLLGHRQDLGLEGEGLLALRAGELRFFQEEALSPLADAVLCIAKPEQRAEPGYTAQMEALRALLAWGPGLACS